MRVDILGVGFDNVTLDEAIVKAKPLINKNSASYIVTPNSEIVYEVLHNPELGKVINDAALVLPDGIGVIYASKILGSPIKGKVAGIEFAEALMSEYSKDSTPFYFLGGKPGIAEMASEKMRERYKGLNVVGTADGYFKDSEPVTAKIRESGAKIVFVCLGAPKQELWIREFGKDTGAGLLIGLGGCLDVFSETAERAPESWRRLGLEWLFRLIKEPKRLGRMLRIPMFLLKALGARIKKGKAR